MSRHYRRAITALRNHYQLMLLIAAVSAIVSLTVELLEHTIWPGD